MRNPAELGFRVRQEAENLLLQLLPHPRIPADGGQPCFPDPAEAVAAIRGSPYASQVLGIAEAILAHRFPLLGYEIETGGGIDWRRDYVHGIDTPARYFRLVPYLDFRRSGDHKVIWELNRHQHLVVLAQAFRLTGETAYLSEIEAQLTSWLQQNPFGRGINWTSALEVAFRALSWIWIDHLAGGQWTPAFRSRVLSALWLHGRHLEANLSVYFSPNTHLLGEALALHAIGLRLRGCPRAGRWRALGGRVVREEMERQVEGDGSHFERSTYYHIYAVDMFLLHGVLSSPNAAYLAKLGKMAEFLAALMDDSGAIPLIGDDDGGRLLFPYGPRARFGRASVAACGVFLGAQYWPYDSEDLHPLASWLFGARAQACVPSAAVEGGSKLFRDCGIAVMRGDAVRVIADAGSFGPGNAGHSHSDTLSIHVRRGAEEILIDPGTFTYVADPDARNRFRGSAAHNTLRVDGRDQAAPAGPFGWRAKPGTQLHHWSSTEEADFLDASCVCETEGGAVRHRRRILLLKPDILIVLDDVDGPPGEHLLEQFWHAGAEPDPAGDRVVRIGSAWLAFPEDLPVEISAGGEFGWRSEVFGAKSAAPVIRRYWRTALPARASAVLAFREEHARVNVSAEGVFEFPASGLRVRLPANIATQYPNGQFRFAGSYAML
jgi:hypothetical protein